MARTIVIDSIEACGRTFQSGEKLTIGPALKKFMIHFRPSSDYEGEYGFDWMRDEYIHPITDINGEKKKLSLDTNQIKKEYKTTDVDTPIAPYGHNYYNSFLNLLLNQEVELNIEIEELETLSADTTDIVFESSNPNLIITPSTIALSDLISGDYKDKQLSGKTINYYTAHSIIKIKCQNESFKVNEEIKVFAQLPNNVENRKEVGKLVVLKNSEQSKYTINVYVIKAFLSDNPAYSESIINKEFSKIGGLLGLENYLNKKSLNQSLIQVKLIDKDIKGNTLKMPLSTYSFNQANIGKNPNEKGSDTEYQTLEGIITKSKTFEVDSGKSVDFFNLQFNKLYSDISKQKCILLYLSPLNTEDAGGAAYTIPLDNKHCIIFGSNLNHLSSYAHEIAHTLGLRHTFLPKDASCNLIFPEDEKINIDTNVINFEGRIQAAKVKVDQRWRDYRRSNATYFDQFPEDIPKYKAPYEENKAKLDKQLAEYRVNTNDKKSLIDLNYLNFERAFTENIMDYWGDDTNCDKKIDLKGIVNKKTLNKYQWKIMQNEAKSYYHQ